MKYSKSNNIRSISPYLVLCVLCLITWTETLAASNFDYFGSDIDYWHDKKQAPEIPDSKVQSQPEKKNVTPTSDDSSTERFQWQKYLDPKNKEFFKEGDYTPPEPFMEIVRNPTDSNLKMWHSYIEKRNQLSDRLQVRMKEYMEKNGAKTDDTGQAFVKTQIQFLPKTAPDAKRFRFRMYFDSHCPHCRKMFGTLTELQSKGFYVEARQVDDDMSEAAGLPIPVDRASKAEIQEKDIQSVPLLLVGDLQKKEVYRFTGFQTVASIFSAIEKGQ